MLLRALALLILAHPAVAAPTLLCLGTYPGFQAILSGEEMRLDYLGDGVFGLEPALEEDFIFARHTLVTAVERWDVFLVARPCAVIGTELGVAIEVVVPTSAGARPLQGCCLWRDL